MTIGRLTALLGLAAAAMAIRAGAYEVNAWPACVLQKDPSGQTLAWTGAGPLLFSEQAPAPDAGTAQGFRPLCVRLTGGGSVNTDILYPLFFFRKYPDSYKWSVFQLIDGEGTDASVTKAGGPSDRHFDVWPFYFSRETGDPAETYHALFPVYGTIKYRLYRDRLSWVLFPLYAEVEKKGTSATYTPFPFVKVVRGRENGFALWPLFGATHGPGAARRSFYLWPLIWDNVVEPGPDAPAGSAPGTEVGFIPFYTRETGPGVRSENYAWPFFGYTEQTIPRRYSERRYFWPFFVQGSGDEQLVNRWGPFYTHSSTKDSDSTWVGWPFWHRKTLVDADIVQSKTQFFYFLYWSLDQGSVSRPSLAHAHKRHLWPLLSIWDNGAGSRQLQFPSPLEVFFPNNPDIRESWSPLFSIYRYDRRPTGETRNSLLWSALTWRRNGTEGLVEFHIGLLLGMRRQAPGDVWTILGFDFRANPGNDKRSFGRNETTH